MDKGKGEGKLKSKSAVMHQYSTDEEILANMANILVHLSTFNQEEIEVAEKYSRKKIEEEPRKVKPKGVQGLIEVENPNWGKPNIDRQNRYERYLELHKQEIAERVKSDLERLALIRQQRVDAAKKREEGKALRETKKVAACKRFHTKRFLHRKIE